MPPALNSAPPPATIVLVGCGRMGGALLTCWLKAFPHLSFYVVDPTPPPAHPRVTYAQDLAHLPATCTPSLVVLAVKPQTLPSLAQDLAPFASAGAAYLSIAAGIKLAKLTAWFGPAPLVRAMPNLPASIGKGMTVLTSPTPHDPRCALAFDLMAAAGHALWAEDEAQMDAVTALSGSGPAYLFALTEAMAEAGKALGLSADMAETLARHTIIGSAALMEQEKDQSPAALREAVTSKGGTTAAALAVFQEKGALQELVTQALTAAANRSEELSA